LATQTLLPSDATPTGKTVAGSVIVAVTLHSLG
jgi:hypothetical protein